MINVIVHRKRRVTAGSAVHLSLFFGNLATARLGLQMNYDLDTVMDRVGDAIQKEETPIQKAG